jgi:hypothetical protein
MKAAYFAAVVAGVAASALFLGCDRDTPRPEEEEETGAAISAPGARGAGSDPTTAEQTSADQAAGWAEDLSADQLETDRSADKATPHITGPATTESLAGEDEPAERE